MKKEISVDLAIIGAGSAGISAFREASKVTDKIALIDHGPLGTTCARIGCMPSKTLIQVADYFHSRTHFASLGIIGAEKLSIDIQAVMRHVRKLRDYFTEDTLKFIKSLGERYIQGDASFIDKNTIKVNQRKIIAKSIIIATGTSSIISEQWQAFRDDILTPENIFEQDHFQKSIAVIGGGPIGIELGQALSHLGIEIELFHSHEFICKLTDPVVNEYAINYFKKEFPIRLNCKPTIKKNKKSLLVEQGSHRFNAGQILAARGQKPNLFTLGLENAEIKIDDKSGLPLYDHTTMQIQDLPIYIAGDVDKFRPLLHEATDEGIIAGYNAVREKPRHFTRRAPLMIVFSHPNIAIAGKSFNDLQGSDFVIGKASFENQGRARIMAQNKGVVCIYAARENGKLLGAEMMAPAGEHLAHMLSHAIQKNMTVFDFLQLAFYHPVIEEGMRNALRHIAKQVTGQQHDRVKRN